MELKQRVIVDRYADMDGAELHDHIDQLQVGFATLDEAIAARWFLSPDKLTQTLAHMPPPAAHDS
jgi:hypothetical protein